MHQEKNESDSDSSEDSGISSPTDPDTNCPSKWPHYEGVHISLGNDPKKALMYKKLQIAIEMKQLKDFTFTEYSIALKRFVLSTPNCEDILREILRIQNRGDDTLDAEQMYHKLVEGANFLNSGPLDFVYKQFGCDGTTSKTLRDEQKEAVAASNKYKEDFQEFTENLALLISDHLKESSQKGKYAELTIKIEENFDSFPIKHIFKYGGILKKVLKLPEIVHLQVASVKQGCVELTFQLIGLPKNTLIQLSLDQKRSLACNKIILFEYNGKVEYYYQDLSGDEVSIIT